MRKKIEKRAKISVIVAVYNTEKYVEKCLNSLLNQTYNNIEIIVVEDCSSDNSKNILKKYATNEKIKIIYNDKNRGLSFSRNIGLKNATGEYIGYIDSDDYVESDYYEKLMNAIISNNAEIAICDMKIVYEESGMELISKCYNEEFNLINIIDTGLAASACNKLFKKELISKYEFSEGKRNEDLAVIIPTLCNSQNIAYAEKCYYYYVQRGTSIQNSRFSDKRFDIFYGVDLTLERIKKHKDYKELEQTIVFNQLLSLFIYVIPKEKNFIYRYKILKKYNSLIKKYNVLQNKYYWKFLEMVGKKHEIYYRALFKLSSKNLNLLTNLLILIYDILSIFLKSKPVVKEKIDLTDLKEAAQKQSKMKEAPIKISAVIPNYNYARFMYQRLYSILNQNYKIHELIILDDCSTDNSIDVIQKIVTELKQDIEIKTIYNEKNSGSAFKQWKKGFEVASGDYIWIAEADDYCENTLISNLVIPIEKDKEIVISYADTAFINVFGDILTKSIKSEIDIQNSGHWDKSYVNDGIKEIENYSFLNCTIANVSSCIIKNNDYSKYLEESGNYKQAGDWLFYVNVMKDGKIAYNKKVLNYYRVHGSNVSSTMNHQKHIDEINKIHKYIYKEFKLNDTHKKKMLERIKFLKKAWKLK